MSDGMYHQPSGRELHEFINEQRDTPLQDGGALVIECSGCGTPLLEVWVIRPNAQITSNVIVRCPCGDKSFSKKIQGQYCVCMLEGSNVRIVNTDTDTVQNNDGSILQDVVIHMANK